MTKRLFWIIALSLLSGVLGRYEDCEVAPSVKFATVRIEDDEDSVRAVYSCFSGYTLEGETELICDLDSDVWNADPPTCVKIKADDDADNNAEENEIDDANGDQQKKNNDIQEDPYITVDYAENLDMSCVSARVKAPEIRNGFVQKYDRRRKGEHVFIVAFYSCNDNFELEDSDRNVAYCSKKKWIGTLPNCIALSDYDEEDYDGYDDGGEEEDDDEVAKAKPPVVAPPPHAETSKEVEYTVKVSQEETEATPTAETTVAVDTVVQGTSDPYSPKVLDQSCGPDKGSCDHHCEMVMYPGENEARVRCTCSSGFTLDPYDYRRCHDIDECDINNGGCEQICNNSPGSYQCSCREGLQIDTATGNTCIDINECESPDIASKCPAGCENTPGSYVCLQPSPEEETRSNEVEPEVEQERTAETTPEPGLESEPKNIPPFHMIECEQGFHLSSDGNCVDIDECSEGIARCENCRNTHGSYECTCSPGFELSDDEITCVDVNECEAYDQEPGEENPTPYKLCSHECENTHGSFVCKCSENFHLDVDRRTCIQDMCEDLNKPELNKSRCAYYCEDSENGPMCKCPDQYELGEDRRTCIPKTSDACQENGGKERCFPGSCHSSEDSSYPYKCSCPAGYKDEVYFCKDIDECSEGTHNCSHICFNTEGSFACSCPIGFKDLTPGSTTCEDIDECIEKPGVCGDKICRNTEGSFVCLCPGDREPDENGECPSEDPCSDNNNGCSQICNSHLHGTCSCEPGYELQDDGRTCRDYDECIDNNGGCQHICVNNPGGYECLCSQGFMLLTDGCFDIDECALDSHNCAAGLLCQNLNGSYACECPKGFAFTEHSTTECADVDECLENNGNCSHICINLRGTFQCSCPTGMILAGDGKSCEHVDGCLIDNGGCSHMCVFNKPLTTCVCPYGYALGADAKTCEDTDECRLDMAKCSHMCVNTVGSFSCACSEGYALAENGRDCVDVDECVVYNGNCSNICINLLGSFSCACESGFELMEDLQTCTDVDECAQSIHDCSHECSNIVGGYECACPTGFVLSPNKRTCIDVDECTGYSGCSHICRNILGSFECECPAGMILDEDQKTCINGDFCARLRPQCSHFCENTRDGFKCGCPTGYILGNDSLTCVDINECLENNGGCSHSCMNLEGSFKCDCPPGYRNSYDNTNVCEDVNECDVSNGRCDHYCINSKGSAYCECKEGYLLQPDGFSCRLLDPCAVNNGGCQHLCVPSEASARCACRSGYALSPADNSSCLDIDECVTNVCPQGNCRNTPGSYECGCQPGYTTNHYGSCVDIDECRFQNGGCSNECANLPGTYECRCHRGLRLSGDKKTCIEIRDQCQPFRPPKYGEIHCTRSRHKTQLYYRTKCKVWCLPGYRLEGPAIRHCNPSGQWDNYENRCVPLTCPPLSKFEHGTFTPANCLLGNPLVGEHCRVYCDPGYVPVGNLVAICRANQTWSHNSTFNCLPYGTPVLHRPPVGIVPRPVGVAPRGARLYIRCPRNTTVLLPAGHHTAHIILQKPKTNIDYRYIESFPAWTRSLQAHLGAGVHSVTFRGRDPNTRRGVSCRTVITVKKTEHPRVTFCPSAFEVSLMPNQDKRSIVWQEPQFSSDTQIKHIHKSNIPGQLFGEGVHRISYEAVDVDGLTARCEFNIVVKAPAPVVQSLPYTHGYSQFGDRSAKLLANHDTYIICAGQAPVKIFGNQPINLPPGCYVKNVRINPVRQYMRRRLITQRWTPFSSF